MQPNTQRLRTFLRGLSQLVDEAAGVEKTILAKGKPLLEELVATDDWLPEEFAVVNPERYQQHLLYCDPQNRFCVVSFVWGPGQETPIHDHTVWGLVGMLRGSELSEGYALKEDGTISPGGRDMLHQGEVVAVSPRIGDIHKVSNAESDRVSISIHVYGGDIGAIDRHVFMPDGSTKSFISGYSNTVLPNVWGVNE